MKGYYSDVWQALGRAMPDRTAIVAPDERISYRRFTDAAGSLAHHLTERGLGPGDGLGILLYNRPEYLVAFYAGFATGIAPTPINYRFRPAEVAALLNDSSAGALLYPASLADVVAEAVLLCAIRPVLIEIDDVSAGTGPVLAGATSYVDVIATPGRLPETPPPGGELRLYTGGTTGRPKAVLWGAEDILDVQLYSIYDSVGVRPPTDMTQAVGIALSPETPRVVSLPLAPFMHGTALFTSINTLILGGTVVVTSSPRLDADDAVRLSVEEGVTRLIVAGDAIALPLAAAAEQAGITRLGRVSSAISSGMRFGDVAKRRLHDLGLTSIIDLLASTEGGPFAVNVTTSVNDVPGTFRLMPGAVVLDEQQEEVQHTVGARGILAFRGTLPRGYLGDEEKTRATFPELRGVRHVVPGDWVRVLPEASGRAARPWQRRRQHGRREGLPGRGGRSFVDPRIRRGCRGLRHARRPLRRGRHRRGRAGAGRDGRHGTAARPRRRAPGRLQEAAQRLRPRESRTHTPRQGRHASTEGERGR